MKFFRLLLVRCYFIFCLFQGVTQLSLCFTVEAELDILSEAVELLIQHILCIQKFFTGAIQFFLLLRHFF